jgi:hypothetical protein
MVKFDLSQTMKKRKFLAIMLVVLSVAVAPVFVFSDKSQKVFVDGKVSSSGDGSSSHPYKTISEALRKVRENGKIFVDEGTYKENLRLGNGIEIYGNAGSKEKVIIQAEDDDESVVVMGDETKIDKVTIKGGKHGIKIEDNSKASVKKCLIKDNKKDGINIEGDGIKKSRLVYIAENEIRDNDDAGIYSGKRRLTLEDNQIENNDGDGIDIEKGSWVWAEGNRVNKNRKSGMKIGIDESKIWIKLSSIRNNKREGIEVSFYGKSGNIEISKSKILNNGNYGVAKVQRNLSADGNLWGNYLKFAFGNSITGNDLGQISGIFLVK